MVFTQNSWQCNDVIICMVPYFNQINGKLKSLSKPAVQHEKYKYLLYITHSDSLHAQLIQTYIKDCFKRLLDCPCSLLFIFSLHCCKDCFITVTPFVLLAVNPLSLGKNTAWLVYIVSNGQSKRYIDR